MAAPLLAAGPLIRVLLILGLVVFVIMFADFGGLADQLFTTAENLLTDLISPF